MGGFFSALFGGSNPTLNSTIAQNKDLSGFSQNVGQTDTTQASDYWKKLLSGDPSVQAQALAPEISGQQQMLQQGNNALAQFGNRGGGTGAAAAAGAAGGRANIINLLGGLQGTAAGNLQNIGSTNLNLAQSANQTEAAQAQERMKNYMQSILGQGISTGIGGLEGLGFGKLPGVGSGPVANPFG